MMDPGGELHMDESAILRDSERDDKMQHGGDGNEGTHGVMSAERSDMSAQRSRMDVGETVNPIDLTSGGQAGNEALPGRNQDMDAADKEPGNKADVTGNKILTPPGGDSGSKGQGEKLKTNLEQIHVNPYDLLFLSINAVCLYNKFYAKTVAFRKSSIMAIHELTCT